jgi:hypothetical protein
LVQQSARSVLACAITTVTRTVQTAAGVFAPGHLGELTRIVPFEMVDAVLAETGATQRRVRELPSRVVVYLLLAAGLFAELGYRQVWQRLVSGWDGDGPAPSSSALAQARRRVGVAPLKMLMELLAGAPAGAVRWRGLLVCAVDGTTMSVPDTDANLAHYGHQSGSHGGSGYPLLRLVAVVACGSRTVLGAVFGPFHAGELAHAPRVLGCLRPGMLLLADRNFAAAALIGQIAATGADVLVRCKSSRRLPVLRPLPDGSWISTLGAVQIRVIDAQVSAVFADGGHRSGHYRLLTTLTDPRRHPAAEVVELYHRRWEIETAYLELKSTILGGRVLRARTPQGVDQEVYALLAVYQALRTAMADATTAGGVAADRAGFTTALHTARDQIVHAAGIITHTPVDLVGRIGRAVLDHLHPPRRVRVCPRVVKRAISKHRAKGTIDRTNHRATITTDILNKPDLTPAQAP